MKKILIVAFMSLSFSLGLVSYTFAADPPPAQSPAQNGFVPLAPIPGLTSITDQNSAANSKNLADFFNNLYKFVVGLAAALAIIEIIWGGLEISTQDSVSKKSDGKERIYQAIFGLVLVLSPVLVFSIINPAILDLSINLPELKTQSGAPAGTGSTVVGTQTPCTTSSGTSDTVCIQNLQDKCRAAGGIPKITGTTVLSVQCDPQPTVPATGSTITVDQCVGQLTNGAGIVYASSAAQNCAAAPANYTSGKTCRDIAGGGACIW